MLLVPKEATWQIPDPLIAWVASSLVPTWSRVHAFRHLQRRSQPGGLEKRLGSSRCRHDDNRTYPVLSGLCFARYPDLSDQHVLILRAENLNADRPAALRKIFFTPERCPVMSRSPIAILLFGLLTASPVFSQPLPPNAEAALGAALQDERQAEAFYAAVMAKFGDVRPFSKIIKAERQHEAMLIDLYKTYGIAIPENGYATGVLAAPAAPETLVDACRIGVQAEVANRDLYDGNLLPAVEAYPDITQVMQRLRDASEENHLPAFERCAAKG